MVSSDLNYQPSNESLAMKDVPEKLISKEKLELYFGDLNDVNTGILIRAYATKLNENIDQRINNMELAIKEKRADGVVFSAHQLRGSFNTMGCPYLAGICEILEKTAHQGDWPYLEKCGTMIRQLSGNFKRELSDFISVH